MNWKVYKDFTESITIDESEIEKAIFAFITRSSVVFKKGGGAMERVASIMPDWNATMGWNEGHKLDAYDWKEINSKNIKEKVNMFYEQAEKRVEYFINTKQTHLINKGFEIKEIESPNNISVLTAKLALDKRM